MIFTNYILVNSLLYFHLMAHAIHSVILYNLYRVSETRWPIRRFYRIGQNHFVNFIAVVSIQSILIFFHILPSRRMDFMENSSIQVRQHRVMVEFFFQQQQNIFLCFNHLNVFTIRQNALLSINYNFTLYIHLT